MAVSNFQQPCDISKKKVMNLCFLLIVLETGKLKYLLSGRGTSAMFLIKSVS